VHEPNLIRRRSTGVKIPAPYKWQFPSRLRAGGFGWRASALACKRLREAASEISKVGRRDPALAAEGAVRLIEKVWPALEPVDSSSGQLGSVVNATIHEVIEYVITAPVDRATRVKWLDRLWRAREDDGVDYTVEVADRWGELCGSDDLRREWLDRLQPTLLAAWSMGTAGGHFHGSTACLSCLLALGHHEELLRLVARAPVRLWHYLRYGVKALVALGRFDEALDFAESARGPYAGDFEIDRACEDILLAMGRTDDAYARYAQGANRRTTGLATFRAIADKYPGIPSRKILEDLIASGSDREGRWFATARQLGFLDVAVDLARRTPCDPRTLNRAARDLATTQPAAALDIALASLKWICEGWGYEVTGIDVHAACSSALKAGEALGRRDDTARRIVELTRSHPRIHELCRHLLPQL
jgi:hypothetical protein